MGDAAEAILDGTFCQHCGLPILDDDGLPDGLGFPGACSDTCALELAGEVLDLGDDTRKPEQTDPDAIVAARLREALSDLVDDVSKRISEAEYDFEEIKGLKPTEKLEELFSMMRDGTLASYKAQAEDPNGN